MPVMGGSQSRASPCEKLLCFALAVARFVPERKKTKHTHKKKDKMNFMQNPNGFCGDNSRTSVYPFPNTAVKYCHGWSGALHHERAATIYFINTKQ